MTANASLPLLMRGMFTRHRSKGTLTTSAAQMVALEKDGAGALVAGACLITNITSGALTFSIHVLGPGESAGDANLIMEDIPLAAKETLAIPGLHLGAGDSVWGSASANDSINYFMSYEESVNQ